MPAPAEILKEINQLLEANGQRHISSVDTGSAVTSPVSTATVVTTPMPTAFGYYNPYLTYRSTFWPYYPAAYYPVVTHL